MYGCESWNIKEVEHWRTDAFKLRCWRGLLRTLTPGIEDSIPGVRASEMDVEGARVPRGRVSPHTGALLPPPHLVSCLCLQLLCPYLAQNRHLLNVSWIDSTSQPFRWVLPRLYIQLKLVCTLPQRLTWLIEKKNPFWGEEGEFFFFLIPLFFQPQLFSSQAFVIF